MVKKILVIDDELGFCETIDAFFTSRGYSVIYALTGIGGLDAFEIETPSIVILDLSLEDIPSLDVLKRIIDKDPTCKVIIVTSSISEITRIKVLELGASHFLYKPFSIKALYEYVENLFCD